MTLTKISAGLIEDNSVTSADITDGNVTNAKMAADPSNASNLSSGTVPLAQLGNVADADFTTQKADVALLAFKTQATGNLARYSLVDQSVDAFEDATGVDASASTGETRDSTGKYYSGATGPTGGTITTHGSYTVNTFLTTANLVVGAAGNIDILMIGGGGSGGSGHQGGGGGGAGGFISISTYPVVAATYVVTVGTGGAGQTNNVGINGVNTTFVGNSKTLTANGGGGGAGDPNGATIPALAGGSGGGGGRDGQGSPASGNQPSNTSDTVDTYNGTGFGGNGAVGNPGPWGGAGGGGGAGGNGSGGTGGGPTSANEYGGAGGVGKENDYRTGSNVFYAGGGGGAAEYSLAHSGDGGNGGGGKGCNNGTTATAGTANTGGAGGGASNGGTGGAGGSGIVVLRHTTGTMNTYNNMTLVSNAQTAQAQPTKADVVLTYTNGAGTATINTDLIASVSRDGGTTYNAVTLVSQGTTGGHTILTANDVSISGQPAGTSMVWKVATTSQSVSKQTRIHAVSLGWS